MQDERAGLIEPECTTRSGSEVAANGQVAGKRPEAYARAHHDEEEQGKGVHEVREDVERAEKALAPGPEGERERIEEEKHDEAAHEPVEHSRHHEGPAHVPVPRSHDVHDADLLARGVDGEAYRIERDQERRDAENERDADAEAPGGLDDVRQAVDRGLVLIEIDFVY